MNHAKNSFSTYLLKILILTEAEALGVSIEPWLNPPMPTDDVRDDNDSELFEAAPAPTARSYLIDAAMKFRDMVAASGDQHEALGREVLDLLVNVRRCRLAATHTRDTASVCHKLQEIS